MLSRKQIISAASKIAKELNPEKIILFGSYAYGTPTEDSDLDICVVEKSYRSTMEEKQRIRNIIKNLSVGKDILVSDTKEYDFYKKEPCSVYREIDERGVILWQKS